MHEVALAYARFEMVAGLTLDCLGDLRTHDAYNEKLIGPILRATSPSLGIIDSVNQIAGAFLESDAEWIFWVDCDMGFAVDTLDALMFTALRENLPAVSALTFKYQQTELDGLGGFVCEPRPVIMNWRMVHEGQGFVCEDQYPENRPTQCQATGMACVLIHRRVYEAVTEKFGPGGENYPTDPALQRLMWGQNGGWHTPMPAPPDATMDQLGPDVSFWARAQMCDSSFKPVVHTGVHTDHQKTTWVNHLMYVKHKPDWRIDEPPDEMSTETFEQAAEEITNLPNRAQRRAAKKHHLDTPGVGGVPLPVE